MRAALPLTADRSWRDFRRELKAALGFRRKTNDWGIVLERLGGQFSDCREAHIEPLPSTAFGPISAVSRQYLPFGG